MMFIGVKYLNSLPYTRRVQILPNISIKQKLVLILLQRKNKNHAIENFSVRERISTKISYLDIWKYIEI